MEHQNSLLWEVTLFEFVLVTVLLAGSAAYLTGRAAARSWLTNAQLFGYMVLLAAATRFIHFALFEGTLLTLHYYTVDLIVLLAIGYAGKRFTRAAQMTTQYGFIFGRSGPFGWTPRQS
ncbi:DUF6867 family protein [Mesorhizobium xinjiangense]|uniref:DUF6867 family protein n=1 Tax=Mesorhizobium xinjiangense TaxID=2678685 RepID=UPI0012EDD7B0|nr:hypothetical protein [Mesorhizobium xinjiangense]